MEKSNSRRDDGSTEGIDSMVVDEDRELMMRVMKLKSEQDICGPRKILIIDPDAERADKINGILTSDGYRVRLSSNPNQALTILNTVKPDIVFMVEPDEKKAEQFQSIIKSSFPMIEFRRVDKWSSIFIDYSVPYEKVSKFTFDLTKKFLQLIETVGLKGAEQNHAIPDLSRQLADRLTPSRFQSDTVYLASLLLDYWIVIRALLPKQKRTDEPRKVLSEFLSNIDSPYGIKEIIKGINERYDGSGPERLQGDQIPIGSRIISLCKGYMEAMKEVEKSSGVADRDMVIEMLRNKVGTIYDGDVVESLVRILKGDTLLKDLEGEEAVESMGLVIIGESTKLLSSTVKARLENEGYSTKVLSAGRDILNSARVDQPAAIISEVILAGMDGFNLCEQLKSSDETRNIPLILVSSKSDPMYIKRGLMMGADDFMVKPIDAGILVTKLKNLTEKASMQRAAIQPKGVSGTLEEMAIPDLIQVLSSGQKTAELKLTNRGMEGSIYLKDGNIVHASFGRFKGEDAFYNLMKWNSGGFQIIPKKDVAEKSINKPNDFLLLEALRRIDEGIV
jgi:response regulator RpfG family c-di-GMP phosphodiesterase